MTCIDTCWQVGQPTPHCVFMIIVIAPVYMCMQAIHIFATPNPCIQLTLLFSAPDVVFPAVEVNLCHGPIEGGYENSLSRGWREKPRKSRKTVRENH